ncbi:TetR/AcrR family transcriptional regulator [Hamadaea tsunoensis]|uniref:TetR/AcrR family transcriptional regulator n=1 Tax=Hamadaea tsunoensis TaxID=53368 RepID=UPI001B7FB9C3|nr:TetR/AcrR family transcriptional regulator [Hamadaea tsunoensis]
MSTRRTPVSRRDRPAKPALSRDGVVAAALDIMRAEGLERLTMRRLAAGLDTGPASLYVYVRNTAELHGAVLDALLTELDAIERAAEGTDADWRERLIELLFAYTEMLMRYPALARSVLTMLPSGPRYVTMIDTMLGLLRRGGVPVRQAAWGVDLLLLNATAVAAEHGTREASGAAELESDQLAATLREISSDEHPNIGWARPELMSGAGVERLRWVYTTLIAGIAGT